MPLFLISGFIADGQVPVAPSEWKPVSIGTGGLVTGMTLHPSSATIRYARTDVGNAYRWNEATQRWVPMVVYNPGEPGGFPADWGAFSSTMGIESIGIDPSNPSVVYIAALLKRSNDLLTNPPAPSSGLFKSTDGGLSFSTTSLIASLTPNANAKSYGERIAVDPANSNVVYFGTPLDGLRRSLDASTTWNLVQGGLNASANVINITFDPTAGTIQVSGQTRTKVLYATVFDSAVYRSADGGVSWTNVTTGISIGGQSISGRTRMTEIDSLGRLYVARKDSRQFWRYAGSTWSIVTVSTTGNAKHVAIDPHNPNRLFALSDGGAMARSLDGGSTWVQLRSPAGNFKYAPDSPFSWLPQPFDSFRSNGGIRMDASGRLWACQGNEGILTYLPDDSHTATTFPGWTLKGQGIEELVAHEVVIPPGSGDKAILTVHDAAGFRIEDPDQFTARQIPTQRALISNGLGVSYAPDDPSFVAFSAGDVNYVNFGVERGANYSGYSTDGGINWQLFGSSQWIPPTKSQPETIVAGQIAVGRRTHLAVGQERIVVLPSNGRPPAYSHDRGNTWNASQGIPVNEFGAVSEGSMSNFSHRARLLIADPFVADRFYFTTRLGKTYVSTNGGQNWTDHGTTGLPIYRWHSQMEANRTLQNDFWFVSGFEGAVQSLPSVPQPFGLFRSTNGAVNFTRIPTVERASCIALGKGRGRPGDEPFTVYIQGKLTGVPEQGVFFSTDAGLTWTRFAYNPTGIFDRPSMMAASWDTFGLAYLGFSGNTYVYGRVLPDTPTPPQITQSPADQSHSFGDQVVLNGKAIGFPAPDYQWERQEPGQTTWTSIPGATTASYQFTFGAADINASFRFIATNTEGEATSDDATITKRPLTVTASATPAVGAVPFSTTFSAAFEGSALAPVYLWDFGDGHSSSAESPVHTYTEPGVYFVTLTVTDGDFSTQSQLSIQANPEGLFFIAGTQVATQTTPNVNNLIDLNLADFTNNQAGQALTSYTATTGQNISGNITRSNLTQGTLLTSSQFDAVIAGSQAANLLSGVINFSGGQGTATSNRFSGINSTGTQVFTSNIAFTNARVQTRSFGPAPTFNNTGGNTNSAPVSGDGMLNIDASTFTLGTPVDAVGFTALQRDGTRNYTWSVRLVSLTDSTTQTITLGGISTLGAPIGMVAGDANAFNYRYDTFVGYQAPAGHRIDRVTLAGGFMNVDSLAYAIIPVEGSGDSFADWLLANPPATGFETDSDNDGLANGIENLLGTDPNTYSPGLTQLSASDNTFTFVHSLSETPASDVTLSYEWSTDLVEWKASGQSNTGGTTATITPSAPVAGQVTVTATIIEGQTERIFMRLVATKTE